MESGVWHQNKLRLQVNGKQFSGVVQGNQLSDLLIFSRPVRPVMHFEGTTRTSTSNHNIDSLLIKYSLLPVKTIAMHPAAV